MKMTSGYSGQQPGDPVRAAQAIIDLTQQEAPPRHLVLGKWGHDAVVQGLKAKLAEIESLRATALATDYPDA
jgi:hypothetical protein